MTSSRQQINFYDSDVEELSSKWADQEERNISDT